MASEDPELLRLKYLAAEAGRLFNQLSANIRDAEVLRHAKDLWLEAESEASIYEAWHRPREPNRDPQQTRPQGA